MITKELLKKVRKIQIKTNRIVNDMLGGEYKSSFKGKGMEFEEVREYQPGDDIRKIDWNVTARTGIPHIKNYREERELVVTLLVDISPSSEFGTTGKLKRDIATEICAVIAFSAISNNDKVSLILYSDKIEQFVPPRKGKKHVLRVIRELLMVDEDNEESKDKKNSKILKKINNSIKNLSSIFRTSKNNKEKRLTNTSLALDYLNKVIKKKSVVFLVSDFIDRDYIDKLKLTNKKHDLVLLIIEDPMEKRIPKVNSIIQLEDSETGKIIEVDFGNKKVRKKYENNLRKMRETRNSNFRANSIDSINIDISEPYIDKLMKFFNMRETRR